MDLNAYFYFLLFFMTHFLLQCNSVNYSLQVHNNNSNYQLYIQIYPMYDFCEHESIVLGFVYCHAIKTCPHYNFS